MRFNYEVIPLALLSTLMVHLHAVLYTTIGPRVFLCISRVAFNVVKFD